MNTSRKLLLGAAGAIAVMASASSALAQHSVSASASASVSIARPIAISSSGSLSFGRIILDGSANAATVVLTPAGGVTTSNATQASSGTISVPTFSVSGEGGQSYTIALAAAGFTGGVTLGNLTSSVSTPGALSGSAGSAGAQQFTVGGTITVPAGTTAGAYSGTVTATVAYQ